MKKDRHARRERPRGTSPGDRPPDPRESGEPGGGKGRRDPVEPSGVYPRDAEYIPPGAEVRMAGSWGGGDYWEAGGSELIYWRGMLLGGLTAGPAGEPTIDIHPGRSPSAEERVEAAPEARGAEALDRDALLLRGLPPPAKMRSGEG